MINKNNIFYMRGVRHRLLHADAEIDLAWTICIDKQGAWPEQHSLRVIQASGKRQSEELLTQPTVVDENGVILSSGSEDFNVEMRSRVVTKKMSDVRDRSWKFIEDLVTKNVPAIYDSTLRGPLVLNAAQVHGCSVPTIYKCLRRFMLGGQVKSALLGGFDRCGRGQSQGIAAVRVGGAKKKNGLNTYQVTTVDKEHFHKAIQKYYLKGNLRSIRKTYQKLLDSDYLYQDGNGDSWVNEEEERPSLRQFRYFLHTKYPAHLQKRAREGDKDFERDHREILGTVMQDCEGVGHQYEADATIADVYLVAADEIQKIIGKPTIYLIIDRKSRLIVGWYVGLENPSWTCAMLALLSISMDKAALCRRLNVDYDPQDWPAHEIFPKEILSDKSELLTKRSDQLSNELAVTVTNVPAKRPDWKPVVECGHKQTREILQDGAPGFDPPENAKARQGKKYDKDACMTLTDFERVILLAVLAHNRAPLLDYPLSLQEIGDEVQPIPIELFNHGIVKRSGMLSSFDAATVRMALLQRSIASVSEQGIYVENCYYASEIASKKGWFAAARIKRFKVDVAYDRRLVDTVFVFDPDKSGRFYECSLTARSVQYASLSFAEVNAIVHLKNAAVGTLDQKKIQVLSDFNREAERVYGPAKKRLKAANLPTSRKARRVDTKPAREAELRTERLESAPLRPSSEGINRLSSNHTGLEQAIEMNVDQKFTPSKLPPIPTTSQNAVSSTITTPIPALTAIEKLRLKKAKTINE